MPEAVVKVENLSKVFHRGATEIKPLRDINLSVEEGEFVVLMGPSGSGKTTLLNIIAGIDAPTSGRVVIDGQDLAELSDGQLSRWRAQNVGYVFQLCNLVPVLTAYENVEMPLLLRKLSRKRRREQVETALEAAGISDRKDHYPRQLSGGQEQRVGIARAIATDPKIIIADEPTGDLDAESEQEIMELLSALNREFKKTFIMVTHNPKSAAYGQTIVRLEKGVLVDGGVEQDQACPVCGVESHGHKEQSQC